jgi:hypothetical protein
VKRFIYIKRKIVSDNFLYFVALFLLLAFRSPMDLITPYLWAEDGTVLIRESVYEGLSIIAKQGNGAYWVIQRIFGLVCYWLLKPFGSIEALPYIMQVLSKSLNVLSVMYFMSDRFSWLVSEKKYRFGICAGIILLMSQYANDTLTCDTSLPFGLFFGVFLIGLDLLCEHKYEFISTMQTVFLTLMALSIASAPCIGVLVGVIAIQWIFYHRKDRLKKKTWFSFGIKICFVWSAVAIQTYCVLMSERSGSEWDLFHRLLLNTKSFMFFPYWNQFHSWTAFFCGLSIWAVILYMGRISWKVVMYSGGFSYLYMLYCSMADQAENAFAGTMVARYVFTCFQIAAFMLGIAIIYLLSQKSKLKKYMAYSIGMSLAILALRTYDIPVLDAQIADSYKIYSGLFDEKGKDRVWIPIGPYRPWKFDIPAEISMQPMKSDLEFGVERLDNKLTGTEEFGCLSDNSNWEISGWATTSTKNQVFKRLLIKNKSYYIATTELTIREIFQDEQRTHNGFRFTVTNDATLCFKDGTTKLEIVGQTEDGVWHSGILDIPTILPK